MRDEGGEASEPPLYTAAFALACLAHLLIALPILTSFPTLAAWVQRIGGSEQDVGLVMAAMLGGGLLSRPVTGSLLDRLGPRPVFLLAGVFAAFGFAGYLLIEQAASPWLLPLRLLHGAGMGALFPTLYTLPAQLSPLPRKTEGMAVFGSVGLVALAVGPKYFGEDVVARWSFDVWCWLAVASVAAGCLLAAALPQPTRHVPAPGDRPISVWFGWLDAFRERALASVWAATLLWGCVICCYMSFLEPLCAARKLGSVAWFFTPYGLVAVALRLGAGRIPDRVGPARMLVPSLLVQLPGLILLMYARSPYALLVAGALCGFGHGYVFPILTSLAVSRSPAGRVGVSLSAFTIAIDAGQFVFNPIAGRIAEDWGFEALFAIACAWLISAVVAFRALEQDPR